MNRARVHHSFPASPTLRIVPDQQAAIDQALSVLYREWRRVASRLSPHCLVSLDREQLSAGPIGQDLIRLSRIANGVESGELEAVETAIESVLQALYWPAGARSYTVPDGFWQTDLGIMLQNARTRAQFGSRVVAPVLPLKRSRAAAPVKPVGIEKPGETPDVAS